MEIKTANTILYCAKWEDTVRFYRDYLNLAVTFSTDWFVEFYVSTTTRISIADEKRARTKSSKGKGVTLSLEVENIDHAWRDANKACLQPSSVIQHPWDALVFYIFDPEGHRVEIWQSAEKKEA
jgi:catechol 2,3-dioxygenase-like lactoylglutathione lyase family enzyme